MADWSLVGYSSHPIPDDPYVIDTFTDHIRAVAQAMDTTIDQLDQAGGDADALTWDSDAAEGFRQVVKKVPKNLKILRTRYDNVADALATFHSRVVTTKAQAEEGVHEAQLAHADVSDAQAGVNRMDAHTTSAQQSADRINASAPAGSPPASAEPWSGPDYHSALTSANQRLKNAIAKVHTAASDYKHAAEHCADQVNKANDDDVRNEHGFWGAIKKGAHWMATHLPLKELSAILGKIAAVAGVLSLIPIPIFQEIMMAVTLIAAVGTLVCDVALTLDKAYNHEKITAGDYLTLGLDVVGVAAAAAAPVLSSAGKTATAGAREASAGARTAEAAATEAKAARVTADAGADAARANVESIRSSNIVSRAISRVTGRTGEAVRASTQADIAAQQAAAEQARTAGVAAAKQQAAADAAARSSAITRLDHANSAVGNTNAAITEARHEHEQGLPPPSLISPVPDIAINFTVSTVRDVGALVNHFQVNHDLGAAQHVGQHIAAVPIS